MATPRTGRPVALRRAGLILVALLAGVAGLSVVTPSAPALPPTSDWHGSPPAAAKPRAGQAQLTGLVTDEANRPVDDILVVAYAVVAGVRTRVPAASALTYEGPRHAHGFYRLHVPAGTYVVVLRSGPYARTKYSPQAYRGQVVAPSRRVLVLDTVRMRLKNPAAAKVVLSVSRSTRSATQRGRATVLVTSRAVKPVLGTVRLTDARSGLAPRTLGTGRLVQLARGQMAWPLPRLAAGRHVLVAKYLGADNLRPATARLVVVVRR